MHIHTTSSEKHTITVVLTVSGTDVLLPIVIFRGKHLLKDICPHRCVDHIQENHGSMKLNGLMIITNSLPSTNGYLADKVKKRSENSRATQAVAHDNIYSMANLPELSHLLSS